MRGVVRSQNFDELRSVRNRKFTDKLDVWPAFLAFAQPVLEATPIPELYLAAETKIRDVLGRPILRRLWRRMGI
jgi:hypothetical protein